MKTFLSGGLNLRLVVPALVVLFHVSSTHPTSAADRTWNGLGTNNHFTTVSNWSAAVVAGDSLFFAGTTRLAPSNDFALNTVFSNLTFNSGAGAFALLGNGVTLTGNITNNQPSGAETVGVAIARPGNTTSMGNSAGTVTVHPGATLEFDGFTNRVNKQHPTAAKTFLRNICKIAAILLCYRLQ